MPARHRARVQVLARPSALARAGWFPWLPVWLSLGIGLWFALRAEPGPRAYAAAAALAGAGLAMWVLAPRIGGRPWVPWRVADGARLGGLALAVAAAGFMLAGFQSARVAAPILGWRYYGPIEGRLVEVDRSARDRIRVTLDQVVLRDMPAARTPNRVRLSLPDGAGGDLPAPGTRLMTTGHLGPPMGPSAPGSFDFRRQAWFEGLGAIGYTRLPVLAAGPPPDGPSLALGRLRQQLSRAMQQRIGGQEGAVASALMTGDRSGIGEATNQLMRDANLYHIVSISGLHMSMLAGFIYGALRLGLAGMVALTGRGWSLPAHKIAAAVALLAAGFYMALSDGGVATERAFVMVAVMLLAILVDRRAISLRTVALAALVLLALTPAALVQPGFQMSFAATVALILCAGPWARVSQRLPRLARAPAMLVVSSLVAGVATGPLAAAHFNRMSEYGLLANFLAVPVMGALVMPAGVIAALLAPLGLAQPALWVMGIGTGWMLAVARFVAGLGGAVSTVPAPPGPVLPLLGLGGAILALSGGAGAIVPRPVMRGLGAVMLSAAALLWWADARPALLVSAEGDAAGLMTAAGRAPSKPRGGGYALANWLTEDGDRIEPAAAAERPGWDGPPGARRARLPDGRAVIHLTGKGTAAAIPAACTGGAVVVAVSPPEDGRRAGDCLLLDPVRLAATGAVAFDSSGRMWTARDLTGVRAWSPPGRPPLPRKDAPAVAKGQTARQRDPATAPKAGAGREGQTDRRWTNSAERSPRGQTDKRKAQASSGGSDGPRRRTEAAPPRAKGGISPEGSVPPEGGVGASPSM